MKRKTKAAAMLTLDYPPSANRYYRHARGRTYLSEEGIAYKTAVGWTCRTAHVEPMVGDVALVIDVYRPRKAGDLDNSLKAILDALQGHLFSNDKQVARIMITRHEDRRNPRVEVTCVAHN